MRRTHLGLTYWLRRLSLNLFILFHSNLKELTTSQLFIRTKESRTNRYPGISQAELNWYMGPHQGSGPACHELITDKQYFCIIFSIPLILTIVLSTRIQSIANI